MSRRLQPRINAVALLPSIALLLLAGVSGAAQAQYGASPGGWSPPSWAPEIEYRFDDATAFGYGVVANTGALGHRCDGLIVGDARQRPLSPWAPRNHVIEFDGRTSYVEAARTHGVQFGTGVAVEAAVRRRTNTNEDGVVSKWYGGDQWLLTIYADGHGRVRFTVRLADLSRRWVDYMVPDGSHLNRWVHLAASFESCGRLRLYWNGRLVAESATPPGRLLATSARPIHVGDSGNHWSRFDGLMDNVRIWRLPAGACD